MSFNISAPFKRNAITLLDAYYIIVIMYNSKQRSPCATLTGELRHYGLLGIKIITNNELFCVCVCVCVCVVLYCAMCVDVN